MRRKINLIIVTMVIMCICFLTTTFQNKVQAKEAESIVLINPFNKIYVENEIIDQKELSIKPENFQQVKIEVSLEETNKPIALDFEIFKDEGILYATTNVNIRELPSVESNIIGTLSKAQDIQKTGICDNGWIRVKFKDSNAYINANYLSETKPIEETYNGIIQYDNGVSVSFVKKVDNYYMMLPENVRNHFNNNGWTIIVSAQSLGQRIYNQNISVKGVTSQKRKTIFIDNREVAAPSIIHEFGHYIDCSNGWITDYSEFTNIFNAEVATFRTIHSTHANNTATPLEYFAESYRVMVLNPELLKSNCPQTYDFISQCINNL